MRLLVRRRGSRELTASVPVAGRPEAEEDGAARSWATSSQHVPLRPGDLPLARDARLAGRLDFVEPFAGKTKAKLSGTPALAWLAWS